MTTATSQVSYCSLADVLARLYTGQAATAIPADSARDQYLTDLIEEYSRQFEQETGRPLNGFSVQYDQRLYSGQGRQLLEIDEYAALLKVEFNSSPAGLGSPNWIDWSADIAAGKIAYKPLRFWPKTRIWRQATWITDPWQTGNLRLTGIFGCIQPDLQANIPTGETPQWNGLTDATIQSLAPNPAGPNYGWWVTPHQARKAVAEWVVYAYHSQRAGYGDQAGTASRVLYQKGIPPNVQRIIDLYRGGKAKLALIGIDGSDPKEEQAAGQFDPLHRFAGWHSYDPTGQHPENAW